MHTWILNGSHPRMQDIRLIAVVIHDPDQKLGEAEPLIRALKSPGKAASTIDRALPNSISLSSFADDSMPVYLLESLSLP